MSLEPSLPTVLPRINASDLRGFEKLAVPLLTAWNQSVWAERLIYPFVRYVSHPWMHAFVRNRLRITGDAHIRGLQPPRGVLLVSNHRTYWDMYVITSVLETLTRFARRWNYPVRAPFFYDHPLGLVVNAAVSGGSMWPPMFRDFSRQPLNEVGLAQCAFMLGSPGSVVGIHPEGTRSKTPDPLAFLKAKGGVGRVVKACHPDVLILPVYTQGMTDAFVREVRQNFRPEGQRGQPIVVAWGQPVRAGDLDRTVAPAVIARELLAVVHALGVTAAAETPLSC